MENNIKKKLQEAGLDLSLLDYLLKYSKGNINDQIDRLIKGEPIQYIVGNVNFYGYEFKVTKDTLIPRFETEELVNRTIKYINSFFNKKDLNIIDLGTGTGCIGITLKKELPTSNVTIVDISDKALEVAKENAKINNVDIKIVKSNFFEKIHSTYDILISNPPYLTKEDDIMDIVKNNEPELALYANDNGLACYKEIINNSKKHLNNKAIIAFEIGYTQGEEIKKIIKNIYPEALTLIEKDLQGKDRFVFTFIQ